jgi:hypothetical protein
MNISNQSLIYLPSFKLQNSINFTSAFVIAEDNLKSLYFENREYYTDFQKFIFSLEILLKIEFEITS